MASLRTSGTARASAFRSSARPSRALVPIVRAQAAPATMTAAPTLAPPAPVPVALPSRVLSLDAAGVENCIAITGQRLVVVTVSTQWCGPCKVMSPELDTMAEELGSSVLLAKIDCTTQTDNRRWAQAQNVKALPTFILFKNGRRVGDMTGAKPACLRRLIEAHM